ncbi:DtxR family iron (metal) dependent repressor [archaeon]|nr:DtxR family iron (metal) dependent repressor [archaeon]MDP6547410.1 metal-dependent transcriptional regulator [Candidatus Woesearchaeota archaeon]MDP7263259.1 metal-dependent transcriptional regulator [Candidatus Woesearchaeota archaeon]HJN56829.1 metal-dependent transcriptional regulator [Candidatus Woesearchaeota archaeon]
MEITNEEEEILERLWETLIEKKKAPKKIGRNDLLNKLKESKHIIIPKDKIKLTEKGYEAAQSVIRRHRLAERLFYDVLNIRKSKIEKPSCEFEHVLSGEVEESICTLLGHPKECPHGNQIPSGKCCSSNSEIINKIVSSLSELKKGQSGKIAYILTQNHKKLQKLMALGVLPGKPIKLIQNFPSYVFQIQHTQIVIDKDMAEDIYIKIRK